MNWSNVLSQMTPLLRESAAHFDAENEQAMYVTAALAVLSGCLPNVEGTYGKKMVSPHIYTAVVAPAASGKGSAEFARKLGQKVDEKLREKIIAPSMASLSFPPDPMQPPRTSSLFVPANTSARALFDALNDRNGRAIIFQTEIDTLHNAMKQDWGSFDDALRAAFHHEPISYMRKEGQLYIPSPRMAVFLSGTEGQFRKLIPDSENGLYSRFGLLFSKGSATWKSQRPTQQSKGIEGAFEGYSQTVLDLFTMLSSRSRPLIFELEPAHWDRLDAKFLPMMTDVALDGMDHVASVVKRAGLLSFRIAMQFSVIRAFQNGEDLSDTGSKEVVATDEDVIAALELADTYAMCALAFSRKLDTQKNLSDFNEQTKAFFRELPSAFEKAEAEALGAKSAIPNRTVRDHLRKFVDRGLLKRVKQGHYEKA